MKASSLLPLTLFVIVLIGCGQDEQDRREAAKKNLEEIGKSLELKDRFPATYAAWPEQLEEMIIRAVEGVWRAEVVSADSAALGIAKETERYGLALLGPLHAELTQARAELSTLGPDGVMDAAERALAVYRGLRGRPDQGVP